MGPLGPIWASVLCILCAAGPVVLWRWHLPPLIYTDSSIRASGPPLPKVQPYRYRCPYKESLSLVGLEITPRSEPVTD